MEAAAAEEETCSNDEYALLCREGFSREDVAAVTIQAYFRGHLVRIAPSYCYITAGPTVCSGDGVY